MSSCNVDCSKPEEYVGKFTMGKNCRVSNDQRRLIIELVCDNGKTHDEVSKLLLIKKGTVSSVMRVFKLHNRIEKLVSQGRKPILTQEQEAAIALFVNQNSNVTLRMVRKYITNNPNFNLRGKTISLATIDRILKKLRFIQYETDMVEKLDYGVEITTEQSPVVQNEEHLLYNGATQNINVQMEDDINCEEQEIGEISERKDKRIHRQLSNDERRLIIELATKHNKTHLQVSNLLHIKKGTVSSVLRIYKRENRIEKRTGSESRSFLNKDQEKTLQKYIKQHKNVTLEQLRNYLMNISEFKDFKRAISLATLQKIMTKLKDKNRENCKSKFNELDLSLDKLTSCMNSSDQNDMKGELTNGNFQSKNALGNQRMHCKLNNNQRRLIIELITQHNKTQKEVSKLLNIKKGTVSSVIRVYKRENRIDKQKYKGKQPKLTLEQEASIFQFIQDHRSFTLKQVTKQLTNNPNFNFKCNSISVATIQRLMRRRQVTLQSLRSIIPILNSPNVLNAREAFSAEMLPLLSDSNKFVYIDICGLSFDLHTLSKSCKNRIGERATVNTTDCRGGNMSLCAAISLQGLLASRSKLAPFTKSEFCNFVISVLQKVNESSYIIMTDMPFNKTDEILNEIERRGHVVKFLPPHSPFLNPLEELFVNVKSKSKSMAVLNRTEIINVLASCMNNITLDECKELINNSFEFLSPCLERLEVGMSYEIFKMETKDVDKH